MVPQHAWVRSQDKIVPEYNQMAPRHALVNLRTPSLLPSPPQHQGQVCASECQSKRGNLHHESLNLGHMLRLGILQLNVMVSP